MKLSPWVQDQREALRNCESRKLISGNSGTERSVSQTLSSLWSLQLKGFLKVKGRLEACPQSPDHLQEGRMVSVLSSGFEGHSFGPVAACHVPLSSWPQCRSTDSGGCHGFSQRSKHHPVCWHQPHRGEGPDPGNAAPNSSLSPDSCERNGHPPKGGDEGTGM